mgnify:CR=1 FL=1
MREFAMRVYFFGLVFTAPLAIASGVLIPAWVVLAFIFLDQAGVFE